MSASSCKRVIEMLKTFRLVLLAGVIGGLVGCQSEPVRDANFAPVAPVVPMAATSQNGAIYQAGFERSWFENVRARRVGDILLVTLVEDTEAVQTNAGTVSKSQSTDFANPTVFGRTFGSGLGLETGLSSGSSFSGSADNTQNNQFSGSVSVMVTEVLANGYLKVRGEKRISMTAGNEYIRVSGIVRPEDIATDNTVQSTKIADATLAYLGDGQNSMASQMGWLAKFFVSAIMPF